MMVGPHFSFVVVAQCDHATPRPPHRFAPAEFVPWVQARLREGLEVHVVYEGENSRNGTLCAVGQFLNDLNILL
jgi:hypothetical protein